MNKKQSCLLCWLPLVLFVMECAAIAAVGLGVIDAPGGTPKAVLVSLTLIAGYLLFISAMLGVLIWLIIKTVNNPVMNKGNKIVWVVCLLLFRIVTFPIYWFIVLRKE